MWVVINNARIYKVLIPPATLIYILDNFTYIPELIFN